MRASATIPIRSNLSDADAQDSIIGAQRRARHEKPPNYNPFRADIARDLAFASSFDEAPHARSASANLVGLPFLAMGPAMPPILARKEARRGLSPALTGGRRFIPCALAEARPAAFNPPAGFFPAFRCQAGVTFFLRAGRFLQIPETLLLWERPPCPVSALFRPTQPQFAPVFRGYFYIALSDSF